MRIASPSTPRFTASACCLAAAITVSCQAAQAGLIHQYTFNSSYISNGITYSTDSIGGNQYSAQLVNGATVSSGQAILTNNNIPSGAANVNYVSIPVAALPTTSSSLTLEEWFTGTPDYNSSGGYIPYNRGFDFNNDTLNSNTSENTTPNGTTGKYFYQALDNGHGTSVAGITGTGYGTESHINANAGGWLTKLPPTQHMIAMVIDASASTYGTLYYYLDGNLVGSVAVSQANQWTTVSPAFTQAWLGRSAFSGDGVLNGSINEFDIYNNALSATQIQSAFTAGPVPTPVPAAGLLTAVGAAGLLAWNQVRAKSRMRRLRLSAPA